MSFYDPADGNGAPGFWLALAVILGIMAFFAVVLSGCAAYGKPKVQEIYKGYTTDHLGRPVVVVHGAVRKPAHVLWFKGITALDAVVAAGDLSEGAEASYILVQRADQLMRFDYQAVASGKEKDPLLIPGDRIWVQASIFHRLLSPLRGLAGPAAAGAQAAK